MNRRELLRRAFGIALGGGLIPASGLGARSDVTPPPRLVNSDHAYLVGGTFGWLSAEVQLGTQGLPFSRDQYELKGFYWAEPARRLSTVLGTRDFGDLDISSVAVRTTLDKMRCATSTQIASWRSWVVALKTFQLTERDIRTHFALFSEPSCAAWLPALKYPGVIAVFKVLDRTAKVRTYTDCKLIIAADRAWNDAIACWREPFKNEPEPVVRDRMYPRIEKEIRDSLCERLLHTSDQIEASGYRRTDVIRAYREGWV